MKKILKPVVIYVVQFVLIRPRLTKYILVIVNRFPRLKSRLSDMMRFKKLAQYNECMPILKQLKSIQLAEIEELVSLINVSLSKRKQGRNQDEFGS